MVTLKHRNNYAIKPCTFWHRHSFSVPYLYLSSFSFAISARLVFLGLMVIARNVLRYAPEVYGTEWSKFRAGVVVRSAFGPFFFLNAC